MSELQSTTELEHRRLERALSEIMLEEQALNDTLSRKR
jgi:hypothetical protein